MVPWEWFAKIEPRENGENGQRDNLLDDLQLKRREFAVADAIRRTLKAIGDPPD
jgi:hypothetical protein